ncbi:MAG: rhodanese-like domain-containing protein [Balneolales bacterium]|nr:rhodanese-like domain-containing protein [Balneolales bacterium]
MFDIFKNNTNPLDISSEDFKKKHAQNSGVVIDVRTLGEHQEGHLAITDKQFDITNGDFQNAISELDKKETYYLYCRSGNRSGQAARMMKQEGFENVFNVGGFDQLVRDGFEPK